MLVCSSLRRIGLPLRRVLVESDRIFYGRRAKCAIDVTVCHDDTALRISNNELDGSIVCMKPRSPHGRENGLLILLPV